jgi:SHS2 domain-containing protein
MNFQSGRMVIGSFLQNRTMTATHSHLEPEAAGVPWLQPLDHTADTGIVVTASDLRELFARAAWGMFSLITDIGSVRAESEESIVVTATDREALLVRWLSELNFLHATRHRLFSRFEVRELQDHRLIALVAGEGIARERHTIHTEIKAVTFHGLRLQHGAQGWTAAIIFDL